MAVICTVTSKSFHGGTGVLINSLVRANFKGRFILGHLHALPDWYSDAQRDLSDYGIVLEAHKLSTGTLPHYQKVSILEYAMDTCSGAKVFYIDSDIIIQEAWAFFDEWAECGVALCSDINFMNMSENHPMRSYWRRLLKVNGYEARPITGYANSGFIGIEETSRELLGVWRKLLEIKAFERGENIKKLKKEPGFITFDQDLLNAALMAVQVPVSFVGHEGMSFDGSVGYMVHPVGSRKPWNKGFLKDLIVHGRPMPLAARQYWKHVDHPIKVASNFEQALARIEMDVTAALSRLIAR